MLNNNRISPTVCKYSGIVFFITTSILITGCADQLNQKVSNVASETVKAHAPLRQLNPHPQADYKVQIVLNNAPGNFQEVKGAVQYSVKNLECGKEHPMTGTVPRITSAEEFKMEKVSENQYTGVFYTDMILDGDYYKNGVCQWQADGVSMIFLNTIEGKTSGYSIYLDQEDIQNNTSNTRYYWQGHYQPSGELTQFISPGRQNLNEVLETKKKEYFSISIRAQKID